MHHNISNMHYVPCNLSHKLFNLALHCLYLCHQNFMLAPHCPNSDFTMCAADFSLLNLPKGKSLGRSKPATNS